MQMEIANFLAGNPTVLAPKAGAAPTHALGRSQSGIRFRVLSDAASLTALETEWRALEHSAPAHAVFQSFDWCKAWAKVYAKPQGRAELSVICGDHDGRLVLIWPLMRTGKGRFGILRWLSEPLGQYGDVLIAPGFDARPLLRAAWDFIGRLRGADTICLRHVRADAAVYPFLVETFQSARAGDAAPYLDLTRFANETAYESRYTKEQRKRRRKIRKDLEARGPVDFTLLKAGGEMDRAMEQALAEKRRWLSRKGLYSNALNCPNVLAFLKELSRAAPQSDRLVTSLLTAGGTPVSWEIGLRFKGRHFGFITAHDTSLTDASPARLHMDLAQRRAIADGLKLFDLMVPNDPHKESWSNGTVAVHDFHAPLSVAGLIYSRVYMDRLRPLARRIYYHAPDRLRRYLTTIVSGMALLH